MKNKQLKIIAGPCSIDEQNISEIYALSEINANGKKAISGTRVVGLKSRTALSTSSEEMGMDLDGYLANLDKLMSGANVLELDSLPSAKLAKEINSKTNLTIATEIMNPIIQLASMERELADVELMAWNPSVNQLGWPLHVMGKYATRNKWNVGIKNGKWLDIPFKTASEENYKGGSSLEKAWVGLSNYVKAAEATPILIHRGVDTPGKGDYRSAIVHGLAAQTKRTSGTSLYFDPSHSYGPKLRDRIVEGTIEALQMKLDAETYLYDGLLIEVGTSKTDTDQHISLAEMQRLVDVVGGVRELV